ncbi:unnamed protein product, partial [Adineta ricciae]
NVTDDRSGDNTDKADNVGIIPPLDAVSRDES